MFFFITPNNLWEVKFYDYGIFVIILLNKIYVIFIILAKTEMIRI